MMMMTISGIFEQHNNLPTCSKDLGPFMMKKKKATCTMHNVVKGILT